MTLHATLLDCSSAMTKKIDLYRLNGVSHPYQPINRHLYLQQIEISNSAAFSKITKKA